jgi:hypothetical protein
VVEQGYNHFSWQGWRKVWQMGEEWVTFSRYVTFLKVCVLLQ